VSKIIIGLVNS